MGERTASLEPLLRRRQFGVAVSIGLDLLSPGVIGYQQYNAAPVIDCKVQAQRINKLWSASAESKLREIFLAVGSLAVGEVYPMVLQRIETWFEDWRSVDELRCEVAKGEVTPNEEVPLEELETQVQRLNEPVLVAEHSRMCVLHGLATQDYEASARAARRGFAAALRSRHGYVAAQTALHLAFAVGNLHHQPERLREWTQRTDAHLNTLGYSLELQAELLRTQGVALGMEERFEESLPLMQASLEYWKSIGANCAGLPSAYDDIAVPYVYLQNYRLALEFSKKAFNIAKSALGMYHLQSIWTGARRAENLLHLGKLDAAISQIDEIYRVCTPPQLYPPRSCLEGAVMQAELKKAKEQLRKK